MVAVHSPVDFVNLVSQIPRNVANFHVKLVEIFLVRRFQAIDFAADFCNFAEYLIQLFIDFLNLRVILFQ